jgi:hypothetical protein
MIRVRERSRLPAWQTPQAASHLPGAPTRCRVAMSSRTPTAGVGLRLFARARQAKVLTREGLNAIYPQRGRIREGVSGARPNQAHPNEGRAGGLPFRARQGWR